MMQHDKDVRIPIVQIKRDAESNRVLEVKRVGTSKFSAKNNSEAYLLKLEMNRRIEGFTPSKSK